MRWFAVVLAVVGVVFIGTLLFWPSEPPTSHCPGYRPEAPGWLTSLLPNPPAAQLAPNASPPPAELNSGGTWRGSFTAADGELGVVRVRLTSGTLKITARERGEEDQILCIVTSGPRPSGCGDDNMADGLKGGVIVRRNVATVEIEAVSGRATFIVNEPSRVGADTRRRSVNRESRCAPPAG